MSWRKRIFDLHLYAGLVLGAFLLVACLSGLALAFRPELDPADNPAQFRLAALPTPAPLEDVVAAARRRHAASPVDFVQISPDPTAAEMVRFRDREEVFVDPYGLRILEARNKNTSFFYTMEKLHRYLFLGKQGQWIMGTSALCLFVMLGTGIYLWLPKSRKALKAAFTYDRRLKSRAWKVNLHKVTGIYSALILGLSAFTGGAEFLNWVARTYFPPPSTRAEGRALRSSGIPGSAGSASAEQVWTAARSTIGPFQIARVGWPEKPLGPMQVEYVARDAAHPNALSYLFLDGYTGRVLRRAPYEAESASSRFYLWLLPLHLGMIGGLAGRLVLVTATASLGFLVVTGFWLYYRRKLNPIKRPAPAPARAPEPAVALPQEPAKLRT